MDSEIFKTSSGEKAMRKEPWKLSDTTVVVTQGVKREYVNHERD